MPDSLKPETIEDHTAQAVAPAAICSALEAFSPCDDCPNALLCGDLGECGSDIHREAFEILRN